MNLLVSSPAPQSGIIDLKLSGWRLPVAGRSIVVVRPLSIVEYVLDPLDVLLKSLGKQHEERGTLPEGSRGSRPHQ